MLTIESTWMPINSLEDVSENDLYHVVILKGTKSEAFFSESKDPMIQNAKRAEDMKPLCKAQRLCDVVITAAGAAGAAVSHGHGSSSWKRIN